MSRIQINAQIRNLIIQHISAYTSCRTRTAIDNLSTRFNVPKQVVAGNISWLVRSGTVNIVRCKPNSYLY